MSESSPHGSEILLYQTEDKQTRIEVRLQNETVWLSQRQMADLFQTTIPNINIHVRNIFEEGELREEAVVKKYLITAADGKKYSTKHYNLDAIISVGYRVKSQRGTQFRIWATQRLRELLVKGFTMDDERLKAGRNLGSDYFDELLARIRDIRSSERMFYQKITDIYATSIDYDSSVEMTHRFFQTVQNKMHWAAHRHTAAEVIARRADAVKPNMGLTTWNNAPRGPVRKGDVSIAKNYLTQEELEALNLIVSAYLDFAELQARAHRPMHMSDWIVKLDGFLSLSERDILTHAGKVSHDNAAAHALAQFEQYDRRRRSVEAAEPSSDFDKIVKRLEEQEKHKRKRRKKPDGGEA